MKYADGFRSDLALSVEELTQRIVLLRERTALAEATTRRKGALRVSGNASQADEDAAISTHRELQATLTDTTKELDRVRNRRDLAGQGVFLLEDGKEPEWSWRSMDEIRLESARTARAIRDAQRELETAKASLAKEQGNLLAASSAPLTIPAGATIWSVAATEGAFVERGEQLLTWIDCSRLMVDVPVTETTATLIEEGARAEVTVDGEDRRRAAVVVMSRASSSPLPKGELISARSWRQSSAQVLVRLADGERFQGCPVGRRAFVRFPDLRIMQFVRAYLPRL
jgi:multidrug resistance efflux pump